MKKRLLVNWVTHPLVGMTVEGLRWVNAFRAQNPELEMGLVLNSHAPASLAACLPAIDRLFTLDVAATCNSSRPVAEPPLAEHWDYLFTDPRNQLPSANDSFRQVANILRNALPAAMVNRGWNLRGLPQHQHQPVRLTLPETARTSALTRLPRGDATLVSLVPGSAAEASRTPAPAFWQQLIAALKQRYADVAFVLIGSLTGEGQRTQGVDRNTVDELLASCDGMIDAVDLPLLEQLALAAHCHVHISPHTGMGFAIQCVGTPWLVLSGAREVEYVFNGVPASSVYPHCDRYPCGNWVGQNGSRMYPRCRVLAQLHKPFDCLGTPVLGARIAEIMDRFDDLIHQRIDYHAELQRHCREIRRRTGIAADVNFLEGGNQVLAPDFLF